MPGVTHLDQVLVRLAALLVRFIVQFARSTTHVPAPEASRVT